MESVFSAKNKGDIIYTVLQTFIQLSNIQVLDSQQRGCGLEPHWCQCVVSLSKTHLSLLSTGSTQEDPSQHN